MEYEKTGKAKEKRNKYEKTGQGKERLMRYRYNLGDIRRKAQNRKYQQVKIEKQKGADACTRRRNFQNAVLRGPEYVCSCCHRTLFKKSVSVLTDNMREKIKAAKSKQQSSDKSYSEQYYYKKRSDELYSEQSNYKKGPDNSYSVENYYKKVPEDSYSENIYSTFKKYEVKSVDGKCYL